LRVRIHSINFCKFFAGYKKEGKWIIPKLEYPWEWLAGLIDTDGCILKKDNSVMLYQKNIENLQLVQLLNLWNANIRNGGGNKMWMLVSYKKEEKAKLRQYLPLKHPRKKYLLSR